MPSTTGVERPVRTVQRAFEIVDSLKSGGPATISEIAADLDLAKSTVHRHVATLADMGLVVRTDGAYRLGTRFLDYGVFARNEYTLYAEAKPKVDELAAETEEKIWCSIEEHGRSIHIYGARGKRSVRTFARIGQRNYLHQHAAGKAIMAFLPPERVEWIIDTHGLPALTAETTVDRAELLDTLETIRERGFAFNREESVPGLHAVGAPIKDTDGVAIGAISVSGPANRLQGSLLTERLPDLLLGAVNEIEINLAHAR